jgi:hypothetical protein
LESNPNLAPEDNVGSNLQVYLSPAGVNLQFTDNANDETGFELERSIGLDSLTFSLISTLPPNPVLAPSLVVATDTPNSGNYYNYRVRACNGAGCSVYSNTASLPVPEDGPSSLTAFVSGNSVNLNWIDNADNEYGYMIERKLSSNDVFSVIVSNLPANSVSYDDTNLDSEIYEYRVTALNSFVGNSLPSSVVSATVSLAPVAPGNLQVSLA